MNRFLSVITVVITSILLGVVISSVDDQRTISVLHSRVDSLTLECYKKDTAIWEATSTAIQLSDKLNILHEISPSVHKEVFSR